MIPVSSGVRVWLAAGTTDMRKGMNGLALQVQQALGRDQRSSPGGTIAEGDRRHGGDLYIFRGRKADLVKCLWHDETGMSLYAKD